MISFDTVFDRVIGIEGGFQRHPEDRGNWTDGAVGVGILKGTKYGISAMSYPDLDIQNLSLQHAKDIYKRDWWDALSMDRFRPAMSYQMFDAAINHGMHNATKMLQRAVNTKPDGILGRITWQAVHSYALDDLLMRFLAQRLSFMTNIKTFEVNGRGWTRRVAHNLILAAEDNEE